MSPFVQSPRTSNPLQQLPELLNRERVAGVESSERLIGQHWKPAEVGRFEGRPGGEELHSMQSHTFQAWRRSGAVPVARLERLFEEGR